MSIKNATPTFTVKAGTDTFKLDSVDVGVNIRPGPQGKPQFLAAISMLAEDGSIFGIPRAKNMKLEDLQAFSDNMAAALKAAASKDPVLLAYLSAEYGFTPVP